jgi:hypothetical protein
MNIYKLPLIVYLVSSLFLTILYHKSVETDIIVPSISQTGMKNLNKYSYIIYFVSFLIIAVITAHFYLKKLTIKNKPNLTKILQFMGLCACFLNIIQGYYQLDTHKKLHENTAYGGIFLHLTTLSIWLYYNHSKNLKI